jgi:hypothetical protein
MKISSFYSFALKCCLHYTNTVSFFKVRFLGSFGRLAVLAVGFGASLAGEVSAAIFYRAKASKGS